VLGERISGVQISPPSDMRYLLFPLVLRYQTVSYRLDQSALGNRGRVRHMVSRCNVAGVQVMPIGDQSHEGRQRNGQRWQRLTPIIRLSTVPYVSGDFHSRARQQTFDEAKCAELRAARMRT